MTKTMEITINIEVAKKMLKISGYTSVDKMTDEEIFEKTLQMNVKYGMTYIEK